MPDPLTILLFVAAGEGSEATTRAMARATREALGPSASVQVRETSKLTDDEALIAEQLAHADAVVDLTWSDSGHRNATLRVHVARSGRWIGRSIGFMPSDASTERGRTIGFAVVSMLPEIAAEQPSTPSAPASAPSTVPSAPASAPLPEAGAERDRPSPPANEALPPSALPAMSSFALDLFAIGAWGIGGDSGDGGGGGVAVSWFPLAPLSFRLGGGVRAGSPSDRSSTVTAAASAGVAWHPVRPTASHPFGVSLRVDCMYVYQSLRYVPSVASPSSSKDDSLPGLGAVVDVAWLFGPDVAAVIGLGLEDVFWTDSFTFHSTLVATLPPLRAVGEVGVRVRF